LPTIRRRLRHEDDKRLWRMIQKMLKSIFWTLK
jgi:hypothetical protein